MCLCLVNYYILKSYGLYRMINSHYFIVPSQTWVYNVPIGLDEKNDNFEYISGQELQDINFNNG